VHAGGVAQPHRLGQIGGLQPHSAASPASPHRSPLRLTVRMACSLLLKRPDIMSAIGQDSAKAEAASLSSEPLAVQERHATLNPNFEAAAAKLFGSQWLQCSTRQFPVVGDSKPLQAIYPAEGLDTAQFSARAGPALDALARRVCGGLSDRGGG
jgi:hypothetical protein